MSIKFDCACGNRLKAPDGSAGRYVRCPACRAKMAVPGAEEPPDDAPPDGGMLALSGGGGGGMGVGTGVRKALDWQKGLNDRRATDAPRWLSPKAEQWLIENGVWVPSGIGVMAFAALLGLGGYAAGFISQLPIAAFLFLVGLGCFLYGRYAEE